MYACVGHLEDMGSENNKQIHISSYLNETR